MQMQLLAVVALLLVARAAAEQPQEVSNAQPVPVQSQPQPQSGPAVGEQQQPPVGVQHVHHHGGQSYPGEHHTHAHSPVHYAPSGLIQLVAPQQAGEPLKPGQQLVRQQQAYAPPSVAAGAEQYGQPEAAGVPPNYKPFGSWGLYIGGNPADGYYSNYYKALSNSVDKQQVGVEAQQAGAAKPAGIGQASAFGPILRQAGGAYQPSYSSYQDQVYPFDYYTPADLNSGSRVSVSESPMPSVYAASANRLGSPAQVGSQVYGSPAFVYGEQPGSLSYADSYSTKRIGSSSSFVQKPEQQQQLAKGYQQQQQHRLGYAAYAPVASPPQVVAYPVPVGSQIVGSQPGVESSFQPYGVHGFTRYAIKPTMVAAPEQAQYHYGVHSSPVSQFPAYKQVGVAQVHQQHSPAGHHQAAPVYQPLSFYGYPLSQLHYSSSPSGAIVPAFGQQQQQQMGVQPVHAHQAGQMIGVQEGAMQAAHGPAVGGAQVEAASSEKSESEVDKASVSKQQQKRA